MVTALQFLAQGVLVSDLPTNFVVCGRRPSKALPGCSPSGFSLRPYHAPGGEIYEDWSWKPSAEVRAAIARGKFRFGFRAFDDYLAGLSEKERGKVLEAKRTYESDYAIRMQALMRVFQDQMEGWTDDNEGTARAPGSVSLSASRL